MLLTRATACCSMDQASPKAQLVPGRSKVKVKVMGTEVSPRVGSHTLVHDRARSHAQRTSCFPTACIMHHFTTLIIGHDM